MITGHIIRQHLNLCNSHVVADTIDYLEAKFFFKADDWDGLDKWVHFSNDSAVYDIRLTEDCIRKEDHLNLSAGMWKVYLHGNEFRDGKVIQRITTDEAVLYVLPTGTLDGEPFPEIPVSVAEQAFAAAQAAKDAAERVEKAVDEVDETVADALKRAKESGEFDGDPGKGLDILGTYATVDELVAAITNPEQGDMYNVGVSAPYSIYMWDAGLGWVDQGKLQGAAGAVYTPSVDANGDLSWTNNGGLSNPPTVNIKGTSVTVTNVSESTSDGGENVVTFSDGKKLTIKNGSKGSAGAAGAAGQPGTSVTVTNVSESTSDGGENVVTFSDGKKLTIKNGSKGSAGAAGSPGTSVTVTNVSESSADGGTNTVTFSDGKSLNVKNGSKGSKGDTGPTGPAYTLTDSDKSSIATMVKNSLTKETWTFELEDGSIVTKAVYVG